MGFNYYLGRLFDRCGLKVVRDYRFPASNLNLLHLGISHLFSVVADPVIVQIGAFDGDHADPLRHSIAQRECRVLLVEPQPEAFAILKKRHAGRPRTLLENSAVAAEDGERAMFLPKNEETSPKASLDPAHLARFGLGEDQMRRVVVKTVTVPTLLARHGLSQVDALLIDTEGHDYKILSQFFAAGIEPAIVNLEVLHLDRDERLALRRDLQVRGYLYQDYAYDTFAIKGDLMK